MTMLQIVSQQQIDQGALTDFIRPHTGSAESLEKSLSNADIWF